MKICMRAVRGVGFCCALAGLLALALAAGLLLVLTWVLEGAARAPGRVSRWLRGGRPLDNRVAAPNRHH